MERIFDGKIEEIESFLKAKEISNLQIEGNIYKTFDYPKFKKLHGNRPIIKSHVAKLILSMQKNYLISPINVNKYLEIIDGQHRFEAIKTLNLPLYFYINPNYSYNEVIILNENQKNWSQDDFLKHHIILGNKHYIAVKELMDTYKLKLSIVLIFLQGAMRSSNVTRAFKAGQLEFGAIEETAAIEAIKKYKLMERLFSSYVGQPSFAGAFIKLLTFENFEWKRFYEACNNYPSEMQKRTNVQDYLRLFQYLYNYHRAKKTRFLTKDFK
jgi:hypothetical protein